MADSPDPRPEPLLTRDGHPISLHRWSDGKWAVYVQPLASDFPDYGGPTCGWTDGSRTELDYMLAGCGLKPDHTCGHAFGISISYRSLFSEAGT